MQTILTVQHQGLGQDNQQSHYLRAQSRQIRLWQLLTLAAIFCLSVFYGTSANCQIFTGGINGVVSDAGGNVIVGATVTVKSVATQIVVTVKTQPDGAFIAQPLSVGTYEVTFDAPGFEKVVETNVGVEAGNIVKLDEHLTPGSVTATVEVNGEGTHLETEKVAVSTTIEEEVVQGAPVVPATGSFRDSTILINLTPGVSGSFNGVNIAGGRAFSQEVQIDGVPQMFSPITGTSENVVHPSFDVITEVYTQPGVPAAEFGRSSGGAVTELTRAGGSAYHGNADIFLRNTAFDARAYNVAKAAHDQQYELPVSFGGPIWIPHVYNGRGRSFFFFNWDHYWTSTQTPEIYTIPTAAERTGDFSAVLAQNNQTIYDPTTQVNGIRQPFPGNKITPTSAIAKAVLAAFPAPTNGSLTNNLSATSPNNRVEEHDFVRLDHNLSQSNTIHGTWRHDAFNGFQPDGIFQANHFDVVTQFWNPWWDWIIRPNLLNHFQAAYIYYGNNQGVNYPGDAMYPNTPMFVIPGEYPIGSFAQQEPAFTWAGYTGAFVLSWQKYGNHTFEYNDSVTWTKAKHNFKFGERFDAFQNNFANAGGYSGTYNFAAAQTGLGPSQGTTAGQGNAMASFLLGDVSSATASVPVTTYLRSKYFAIYGQDSWRITSKLTLNYGFRWEMQTPIIDARGSMSNFSPTLANSAAGNLPGAMIYAGTGAGRTGSNTFTNTWKGGYSPRFGLAYDLGHNMVVRAGYGILYAPLQYSPTTNGFTLSSSATSPDGFASAFSLDSGIPAADLITSPVLTPTVYNNQSVTYFDPRNGKGNRLNDNQIWQLDIQKQFGRLYLDVGYEGFRGHHIPGAGTGYEQLPDSDMALGTLLQQQVGSAAAKAAGIVAPYPTFSSTFSVERALTAYPQFTGVGNLNYPSGSSSWDGLLVKVQKQYSNGFSVLVAYTWSKEQSNTNFSRTALSTFQDATNPKSGKSIGDLNQPANLQLTYLYDLPMGRGKKYFNHGFSSYLLGGFGLSASHEYQSGFPIHIAQNGTGAGIGNPGNHVNIVPGVPLTLSHRSNTVKYNALYDTTGTNHGTKWLNPAAFVNPPAFTYGNTRYMLDHLQQLAVLNENFSFYKRTNVTEKSYVELRCEMFNAFNRMNYAGLDLNMADNTANGHFGEYEGNYSDLNFGTAPGPKITELEMKINF